MSSSISSRNERFLCFAFAVSLPRTDVDCRANAEQVETLLRTQEPGSGAADVAGQMKIGVNGAGTSNVANAGAANFNITNPSIAIASDRDMDRWRFNPESPQAPAIDDFNFPPNIQTNISMSMSNVDANFTWEMIGLGLDEPLPPQETIDELYGSPSHPHDPFEGG